MVAFSFLALNIYIYIFSTLGSAWPRKEIFSFAFCLVGFFFFFSSLVNLSFNSFICVTLNSESGRWFSLITWKLQSHSPSLRSWQVEPELRFLQNYSVKNEDSKRALPPIFMLSLFLTTTTKKSGNWNLRWRLNSIWHNKHRWKELLPSFTLPAETCTAAMLSLPMQEGTRIRVFNSDP